MASEQGGARSRRSRTARDIVQFLTRPAGRLPRRIAVAVTVARVVALHEANGGVTYNLHFGNVAGKPLYAVSLCPERSKVVAGRSVDAAIVRRFILDNDDLLGDPRNNVGTWYNESDDTTYLDISTALPDRDEAVAIGRQYNQIAIFDLSALQALDIGGTGEPVTDLPAVAERVPPLRPAGGRSRKGSANER
jgi:hypothetical protein